MGTKVPEAELFGEYLKKLRRIAVAEKTEHTDRAAIQGLLEAFAKGAGRDVKVQHEPKKIADKGAPDFKVTKSGMILGYVETKALGENLAKVRKSDQIARYLTLSDNIMLTDYVDWMWLRKDSVQTESLCHESDLDNPKFRLREDRIATVAKLIEGFFSTAPEGIGRAETLALALATRAHLLRDYLGAELVRQEREHQEGRLFGLYQVFKTQVFHELGLAEFADAFAQMLAYGLFLARLNADVNTRITLGNVREHVPGSFQLIRELVSFLDELDKEEYAGVRWVVEEVLSIVNGLDLAAIHEDLSFRQRKAVSRKVRARNEEEYRLFSRDPFVYFYEDFLAKYDAKMKKSRGVYYTPPPIVNFIVRAVDDILKESFRMPDGLADHKRVTVLDFACGTGTFLLETFQRIFDNIGGPDSGRADLIVREHILKNLFGFEYLIAPYTIAHLKLSQYLTDKGHPLKGNERLRVYLTNTLEPIHPEPNFLLPAITEEAEAAQAVKDRPILVIVGNPPYSGHSKNKGVWITAQIAKYREGFPDLAKPAQGKWLQDDYVKFIRFAQLKMDAVEEGVVGVITNHSWLDNPTFKGMRKSLMTTFDQIFVLDLHGNAKKKEHAPDGGKDENVFDIEQGVAISLFVKNRHIQKGVWHSEVWGRRVAKYQLAAEGTKTSLPWKKIQPGAPDWLLRPQNINLARRYRQLQSVPTIFNPLGDPAPGIVTTQDEFAVSFEPSEAREKVRALLSTTDEKEARRLFRLCSQSQWSYSRAKTELPQVNLLKSTVGLTYRPFDDRWTIWDRNVAVHRRERVMRHMLLANLALLTARSNKSPDPDHFFVADKPSETKAAESTIQSYSFPLYMYVGRTDTNGNEHQTRYENLSSEFRAFIDLRYEHHYTPEEILGYIYAVLYAPSYRTRYAEFLRADFPRIPFAESADAFDNLSGLGWALVQAHLLKRDATAGVGHLPRQGQPHG